MGTWAEQTHWQRALVVRRDPMVGAVTSRYAQRQYRPPCDGCDCVIESVGALPRPNAVPHRYAGQCVAQAAQTEIILVTAR
jgi:hypothetical protein